MAGKIAIPKIGLSGFYVLSGLVGDKSSHPSLTDSFPS